MSEQTKIIQILESHGKIPLLGLGNDGVVYRVVPNADGYEWAVYVPSLFQESRDFGWKSK